MLVTRVDGSSSTQAMANVPLAMDVRLLAGPGDCPSALSDALLTVARLLVSGHDDAWYNALVTAGSAHFGKSTIKTTKRACDGTVLRRFLLEPEDGLARAILWFQSQPMAGLRLLLLKQDGRRGLLLYDPAKLKRLLLFADTIGVWVTTVCQGCIHTLRRDDTSHTQRIRARQDQIYAQRLVSLVSRFRQLASTQLTKLGLLHELRWSAELKRAAMLLLLCQRRFALPRELVHLIMDQAYSPALPPRRLRAGMPRQ